MLISIKHDDLFKNYFPYFKAIWKSWQHPHEYEIKNIYKSYFQKIFFFHVTTNGLNMF